jgi:hypothetical protein
VLSKQSGFRKTWTKGAREELGDNSPIRTAFLV